MMDYIYPAQIKQETNCSILNGSAYDFTKIHLKDVETIKAVIDATFSGKYSDEELAIGMINESYSIKYTPRYILHEIIIQVFQNSVNPLDVLAVGFAYVTKGASQRSRAIEYLERYLKTASHRDKMKAEKCYVLAQEPFFSYNIAQLYENDTQIEKAIKFALQAERYSNDCAAGFPLLLIRLYKKYDIELCEKYCEETLKSRKYRNIRSQVEKELEDVRLKKSRGYKYKPRQKNYEVTKSEIDLHNAAKYFIKKDNRLLQRLS